MAPCALLSAPNPARSYRHAMLPTFLQVDADLQALNTLALPGRAARFARIIRAIARDDPAAEPPPSAP